MSDIKEVLKGRGKTHGGFSDNAALVVKLSEPVSEAIRKNPKEFSNEASLCLDMIIKKIARIACGDPDFEDHWVDIIGYSTLVLEHLRSKHEAE